MTHVTPTIPPPEPDSLSSSLKRNIQALEDRRRQQAAAATWEERIAESITRFTGSMRFVYLHVILFGAWLLVNLGVVPGVPRFDRGNFSVHLCADQSKPHGGRSGQARRSRPAHQPPYRARTD